MNHLEFGYGIKEDKLYDKLNHNLFEHSIKYNKDIIIALNEWLDTFNDISKNNIASDNLLNILESKLWMKY